MTWAAVAIGGAALVSAGVGYLGSQNAAKTQAAGIAAGQGLTQQEFNTITAQEQPYVTAGYGALNQLDYLMGIGPSNGYNAEPGTFNSAMAPFASAGAPPQVAPPNQTASQGMPQAPTVYGVNGTTPNYGVQNNPSVVAPQAGGPLNAPPVNTGPGGRTMGKAPEGFFSTLTNWANDMVDPIGSFTGKQNITNPIMNKLGLAGGFGLHNQSAPAAATTGTAVAGAPGNNVGYGGPPGSYTPSTSTAGGFGSLNAPFTADMMKQYSPAYQFQLQQGGQGVLNTDSGSLGAESGAAFKDLMGFNQNLANTAFNNAFNQYQTQQSNTYSRLAGLVNTGSSAAANLGAQGVSLAGNQASLAASQGAALASGQVAGTNAISSGLNTAALVPWLMQNRAGG